MAEPAFNLRVNTAARYVAEHFAIPESKVQVAELTGGVSSSVLLVETPERRFVMKQSLPQLRVEQEWLCSPDRIWRESSALRLLHAHLPPGSIPDVLFEDKRNYLYAMAAAPAAAEPWKAQLLGGLLNTNTAERAGTILAALFQAGYRAPSLLEKFDDLTYFEQLRLQPYYAQCADRHPDLAPFFDALINRARTQRCTLVHGDWSPKNLLVAGDEVMAIDFEVIHFGDPAFDSGFLLNHLLLKSFHAPERTPGLAKLAAIFWESLTSQMPTLPEFEAATIAHWSGLLLARIDGRSAAEYIRAPELKEAVRVFARGLIADPPGNIQEVFARRAL